jgi:hypothetical protein
LKADATTGAGEVAQSTPQSAAIAVTQHIEDGLFA